MKFSIKYFSSKCDQKLKIAWHKKDEVQMEQIQ